MKPSQLLSAKVSENKTILLNGISLNQITFIGATMPVSVKPGDEVNFFTLAPEKEKQGIVAVAVYTKNYCRQKGDPGIQLSFFLRVENPDTTGPHIDLEDPWIPGSDRLGQIIGTNIHVRIDGELFSTFKRYSALESGYNYVPDPNIICKYLIGEVGPDEVRAAVSEHIAEMQAREKLPVLEKQLENAKYEGKVLTIQNDGFRREKEALMEKWSQWKKAALNLKVAVENSWPPWLPHLLRSPQFLPASVKKVIREFPSDADR